MTENSTITVEVAYARSDEQALIELQVNAGATVSEAIALSKVTDKFPEIDLDKNKIGIFGKKTTLETKLNEFDRVEIYRPLIADPKAAKKKKKED